MTQHAFPKQMINIAAIAGIGLQAYICFSNVDGALTMFLFGLFAWSCVPYLACLAVSKLLGPDHGFYGILACLCGSSLTNYSVFVSPASSTAAIGLLFSPLVNLFFFLPIGIVLGHFNKRLREQSPAP